MKVGAWHSTNLSDKHVYHDNTKCTEGATIRRQDRKPGSVGRPKCPLCTEQNSVLLRLPPRESST
jgi:hypothetical protein